MERQSKEESQMLWRLELESAKHIQLTPEHQALVDAVTKKIEDYTLTYEEYLSDIVEFLQGVADGRDPKDTIIEMCNTLINKYEHGEEVRSEQDQDGPRTTKRGRRSRKNSNNGGREVRREPMAESTELLEEIQSGFAQTLDSDR